MSNSTQGATGGFLLTEKAHPEISIAELGSLPKRVRFLEKWTAYQETMELSQASTGPSCSPMSLKRCIPKAALEGAIIACVFQRRGANAEEVNYVNLTEAEIKNWLVPKATASDLINKSRIQQATKGVYWSFNEKFSKASQLLASDFATKLADIGLKELFSKSRKDMHRCLIEIVVEKIEYAPLRKTMEDQMELSQKVRKSWSSFLGSLYLKLTGLDIAGTRNEKQNNGRSGAGTRLRKEEGYQGGGFGTSRRHNKRGRDDEDPGSDEQGSGFGKSRRKDKGGRDAKYLSGKEKHDTESLDSPSLAIPTPESEDDKSQEGDRLEDTNSEYEAEESEDSPESDADDEDMDAPIRARSSGVHYA